ncbi:MAG: type III-B CRISPR module RAMP protein Cmr6 [Lachnospiraceae bacterium]|nr:type III-B CRISPR module RAMP protein Cmr6 [Lachnospiraceae bacterium]
MESMNMSYAFYREYLERCFQGSPQDATSINREILDIVNKTVRKTILDFGNRQVGYLGNCNCAQQTMQVMYPGAILGSGYPHEAGKLKGEIQSGFSFDHVTGAPFYPGSSVKGVIEDVFERAVSGRDVEKEGYMEYLTDLLKNKVKVITDAGVEKDAVAGLSQDEGSALLQDVVKAVWNQSFRGEDEKRNTVISIRERDIFYDAYVTGAVQGDIIGLDNITPHPDPLKNPIPVTILRLMPGVQLTFSLKLSRLEFKRGDKTCRLGAEEKEALYYEILEEFGIGAKTNLGYGQLKPIG